jgi:DNA modification methylase
MDVLGTNPYAILLGDARRVLQDLPSESVQTIVTSPPYFGLRDYGKEGQIGLEETPTDYINALVDVFREAKRVLREDGTLWLNLGDTYAGRALRGGGLTRQESNRYPVEGSFRATGGRMESPAGHYLE